MKKILLLAVMAMFIVCLTSSQNKYIVTADKEPIAVQKLSKEKEFVDKYFKFYNIADWTNKMQFMIEIKDYSYDIPLFEYKSSKNKVFRGLSSDNFKDKIFTFEKIEEREVDCPRGICKRTYIIFNCDGQLYEHEFIIEGIDKLRESKSFNTINNFVYITDIDIAYKLLLNKTIYIISDQWLEEKNNHGVYVFKQKYIPVLITKIGFGNSDGPVKIVFKTNNGEEYYRDVIFSGINSSSAPVFGVPFQDFFSFDNPKDKYPNISNNIWTLIQNGKVKIGMTKQECKLSWGEPKNINTTSGNFGVHEQWVYSIDSYLYFENGKLTTIQNN